MILLTLEDTGLRERCSWLRAHLPSGLTLDASRDSLAELLWVDLGPGAAFLPALCILDDAVDVVARAHALVQLLVDVARVGHHFGGLLEIALIRLRCLAEGAHVEVSNLGVRVLLHRDHLVLMPRDRCLGVLEEELAARLALQVSQEHAELQVQDAHAEELFPGELQLLFAITTEVKLAN